jgi:hypothetical protein
MGEETGIRVGRREKERERVRQRGERDRERDSGTRTYVKRERRETGHSIDREMGMEPKVKWEESRKKEMKSEKKKQIEGIGLKERELYRITRSIVLRNEKKR